MKIAIKIFELRPQGIDDLRPQVDQWNAALRVIFDDRKPEDGRKLIAAIGGHFGKASQLLISLIDRRKESWVELPAPGLCGFKLPK